MCEHLNAQNSDILECKAFMCRSEQQKALLRSPGLSPRSFCVIGAVLGFLRFLPWEVLATPLRRGGGL